MVQQLYKSLTLVQSVHASIPSRVYSALLITASSILHMTCGDSAVFVRNLVVSWDKNKVLTVCTLYILNRVVCWMIYSSWSNTISCDEIWHILFTLFLTIKLWKWLWFLPYFKLYQSIHVRIDCKFWNKLVLSIICDSTHRKGPVVSQNWLFAISWMAVLSA